MRSVAVCLFCLLSPAAIAADISPDHQGTWTETGVCPQAKRIVVGEKAVTLVEPGLTRLLTDGDEAVFKGETIINASLPAKREQDPVLAFSAKVVEQDGEMTLVTQGLEANKTFAGTFKRCKADQTRTASKQKPKTMSAPSRRSPVSDGYYAGPRLGGLY